MAAIKHGYEWYVSNDPSGDFSGRLLRRIDIQPGLLFATSDCPFDDGTTFLNLRTGEILTVRNGKVKTLEASRD